MATQQPKWKYNGHIGDVDPIAYGGGFVYVDKTGHYAPEMTWFEPSPDETWHKLQGKTPLLVFRVLIENDPTKEWWYNRLDEIASYVGVTIEQCQDAANGTPLQRASLYSDLIGYFGAEEFDSCPIRTTEGKAYFRYWREMRQFVRGN